MAVYRYFRNKDELLQLVFDRVAGEIELPAGTLADLERLAGQVGVRLELADG